MLNDGTVLHLTSFCLTDAELRLEGADDPAFAELKVRYVDVLGGAPAGTPPDRGIELYLPLPTGRQVARDERRADGAVAAGEAPVGG